MMSPFSYSALSHIITLASSSFNISLGKFPNIPKKDVLPPVRFEVVNDPEPSDKLLDTDDFKGDFFVLLVK